MVTLSKFYTEGPHMLGDTEQNIVGLPRRPRDWVSCTPENDTTSFHTPANSSR